MSGHREQGSRAGFSLIEVLIAISVLGLVSFNLFMVLTTSAQSQATGTAQAELEQLAHRTMERITMALVGSSRDSLFLTPSSPFNTSEMNYETNLGFEDGQIVWSDPERIALLLVDGRVIWVESPGQPDQRSVVWCTSVADYLEGEEPNNLDDNGNGLVDELGLSFDIDGNSVIVRLTLERRLRSGQLLTCTMEQRVTCRN